MEIDVKGKVIDIEPNSKPYLLKHIVALLFDVVTLFLLFFTINLGLLNTGLADTYNKHIKSYTQIQDKYMLESGCGVKKWVEESSNNGNSIVYFDENVSKYYIVTKDENITNDEIALYRELLKKDNNYQETKFAAALHQYLISALSGAISEVVLFLVIPLCNKKRATGGQLLTGISLLSLSRQTYAKWYQVLARFLLILIIESCILYLWTGIYTFFLIPVLDIVIMLINKKNRSLRDYLTGTMLIEDKSYSSIIILDNNSK